MRSFLCSLAVLAIIGTVPSVARATQSPAPGSPDSAEAPAPEPAPAALPAELTKAAPPVAGDGKMDFDFFANDNAAAKTGDAATPDSAEVAAKAARRRWMLKVHQTLGITTWALMAATVTVGQLNYNALYGSGTHSTKYKEPHSILVASTTLSFAATGAFAIFAPNPYEKPLKLDTGLVHRIAVIGATAGMITEAILGIVTSSRADAGNPRSLKTLARAHQIIGYSTFGMLTVAGTVWVF
jgi:hypothetical protein